LVYADIAAINTDSERTVRSREAGPVSLAPFDEAMLLFAQFLLQSLGNVQNVAANDEDIQWTIHGKQASDQLLRNPVAPSINLEDVEMFTAPGEDQHKNFME